MLELLTPYILKTILPKVISAARKFGVDKLKKTKSYVELLYELGYRKPDNDFDSIYIHSIVLYSASGDKEEDVIRLFLEDEVKKAFFKAYKTNDIEGFEREINHQLHVNPLVRSIKDWNKIPSDEIIAFKDTFKKLNLEVLSPSDVLIVNEIKDNRDGIADIQKQILELKSMVSSNNTGDIGEELNKEFKAILDEFKSLIDANKIDSALQGLLNIKERNWSKFNSQTKYRVLTNIGICYLRLDKQKESALFFIDALEYKSEDNVALSNAANGYLFIDEIDKALVLADKLYVTNVANSAKALAIRIRAKKFKSDELVQLLAKEENVGNEDLLLAAASYYVGNQNYELAEEYCKKLVEVAPETIIFKEFYIQIVTNLYGSQNHMVVRELKGATTAPVLNNAITLCDECWQYYLKTDLRSNKAYLLVHKSMLLHLLGDDVEALSVISDALKENGNDPYFLKHKALYLANLDRHSEAIPIFEVIKGSLKEGDDISSLLGTSYYLNNQQSEAIQLLEDALNEEQSVNPFNKNALLLLIHIYRKVPNMLDAIKAEHNIEIIINRYPDDVAILADASGYFYARENTFKANEYIEKAFTITQNSLVSSRDLFIVSDELQRQERFEDAIKISETIIDVNLNNPLTYNLAKLYYIHGKKGKALEIYQNLRLKHGIIKEITKYEVRIYQEVGDIEKAREIAKEYVDKFDDINAKIVLNGLNIRLEKYDEVEAFLNSAINCFELSLPELKTLLAQMFKMGMAAKALYIAYEIKRLNETPEYNDFYTTAIITRQEKQNEDYLNIKEVKIDWRFR